MNEVFRQIIERASAQRPAPLPEAIVARLEEAAPRFVEQCPFEPGDLVIGRADAPVSDGMKASPSRVIWTNPKYDPAWGISSRASMAVRKNLMVLCVDQDDEIVAHCFDSAFFERWPRAEAAPVAPSDDAPAAIPPDPNRVNCGDAVLHRPSGEKWLVAAADRERDEIMYCGWPEGVAKLSDCDVIRRATPEASAKLHRELSGARRAMADRVYGPPPALPEAPAPEAGETL